MKIGIVNRKGGCGKSTTAVHMVQWIAKTQNESAVLIDADEGQDSANRWSTAIGIPSEVIGDPEDLFERITECSKQYKWVLVDAPAVLGEPAKSILMVCDLIIVPIKPSDLDLQSAKDIVRLVNQMQQVRGGMPRAVMFLSQATKGSVLMREAADALKDTPGVKLLKAAIYQRQIIADVPGQNTTVFDLNSQAARQAAEDYSQLFEEAITYGATQAQ